jgi:methylphosphotriester-DNA--protein-cysteine methyltransferase
VELKQRLLAVEGVKTVAARNDFKVDREAMYTMVTGDSEYCVPTCGSLLSRSMSTLTLFGTREGAEAAGFAPCTSCRPDLHPLPA